MPNGLFFTARLALFGAAALFVCGSHAQSQTQTRPRAAEARTLADVRSSMSTAELDASAFYEVLVGELLARDGDTASAVPMLLGAARRTDDSALFQRAVELSVQSQLGDAALQSARAWVAAQPSNRAANRTYLQILVALNRIRDSIPVLMKEIGAASSNNRALAIAAVPPLYQSVSDRKLAAKLIEAAFAEFLTDSNPKATVVATWVSIGRLQLSAGEVDAALRSARSALRLDQNSDAASSLMLDLWEQHPRESESDALEMLRQSPSGITRLRAARILMQQDKPSEALAQANLVVAQPSAPAEAWLILGGLQIQTGSLSDGETSLRTFLEKADRVPADRRSEALRMGYVQAYATLASLYEQKNDLNAASTWLQKIEGDRVPLFVSVRRASIAAKSGNLDLARSILQNATGDNDDADKRARLSAEAQMLRRQKQYATAAEVLSEGLKQFPGDAELLYERAMVADRMGKWDEMEVLLREVIRIQPQNYQAYNALGYALADRNVRINEARELVAKALAGAPNDPFIQDSMGWVEFRAGNIPEALRYLEKAFNSRPDAEIAAHLGEVLWTLGRSAQAKEIWTKGQKLDHENETLRDTLKRLNVKP